MPRSTPRDHRPGADRRAAAAATVLINGHPPLAQANTVRGAKRSRGRCRSRPRGRAQGHFRCRLSPRLVGAGRPCATWRENRYRRASGDVTGQLQEVLPLLRLRSSAPRKSSTRLGGTDRHAGGDPLSIRRRAPVRAHRLQARAAGLRRVRRRHPGHAYRAMASEAPGFPVEVYQRARRRRRVHGRLPARLAARRADRNDRLRLRQCLRCHRRVAPALLRAEPCPTWAGARTVPGERFARAPVPPQGRCGAQTTCPLGDATTRHAL